MVLVPVCVIADRGHDIGSRNFMVLHFPQLAVVIGREHAHHPCSLALYGSPRIHPSKRYVLQHRDFVFSICLGYMLGIAAL